MTTVIPEPSKDECEWDLTEFYFVIQDWREPFVVSGLISRAYHAEKRVAGLETDLALAFTAGGQLKQKIEELEAALREIVALSGALPLGSPEALTKVWFRARQALVATPKESDDKSPVEFKGWGHAGDGGGPNRIDPRDINKGA